MDNKLRIKELVLVAAFSVLGIAFMYLIPMPFLFTPYTILISPIVLDFLLFSVVPPAELLAEIEAFLDRELLIYLLG